MSGDLDEREDKSSPPKEQPKSSVSPITPVRAVDSKEALLLYLSWIGALPNGEERPVLTKKSVV